MTQTEIPEKLQVLEEKEKCCLIFAENTKMVGWVPKSKDGSFLSEKEIYGILNKQGVPKEIYDETKGKVTSRKIKFVEVEFDNVSFNEKGDVEIVQNGKNFTVSKYSIERLDPVNKKLNTPASVAEKTNLETKKEPFYMTSKSMQIKINKHFAELKKEKEKER